MQEKFKIWDPCHKIRRKEGYDNLRKDVME